jgi:hypothetical protein
MSSSKTETADEMMRVTPTVLDELYERKERGETYDDVLRRELDIE